MAICECGKEYEPCYLCSGQYPHQECVSRNDKCHDCHMEEVHGTRPPASSQSGLVDGYVDCRICGDKTDFLGTKLCNRCWELERRIGMDLEIAKKIIATLEST